jgi:hypothetical protein
VVNNAKSRWQMQIARNNDVYRNRERYSQETAHSSKNMVHKVRSWL